MRPGWNTLGILAVALVFAGLGAWMGQRQALPAEAPLPPGVVSLTPGQLVPHRRLPGLQDGQLRPLAVPGRRRLVNYWASWCGPCRDEMPALDAFSRQQGANGVEVLGIALDQPEDARAFLATLGVAFPQLVETPGPADTSVLLGNRRGALPYSALIGADGRLLKTHYGAFPDAAAVTAWATADD